ncbi:MAG: ribonuclease III [Armatimonadota bacterium]
MQNSEGHGSVQELQERLQIRFKRVKLLQQALTHRSYLAEFAGMQSNERLEFLGDAVLDLIIAEQLFRLQGSWPEGELTKAKAFAVGERSLEGLARKWDLGRYVRISHGEEAAGGRDRRALLADAVEALIGAYYLDRGLRACRGLLLREMADVLDAIDRSAHNLDFKTQLQEAMQARFQMAPVYTVAGESGPPHDRTFEVEVVFSGEVLGRGMGKSKKDAEQQAAREALQSPLLH